MPHKDTTTNRLRLAPRRPRVAAAFAAATLVLAVAASCSDGTGPDNGAAPPSTEQARRAALDSFGNDVIVPALEEFEAAAEALAAAVTSYRDALVGETADANAARQDARDAFATAMRTLQLIEALQVGPAGRAGMVMGGQDLRDEIYSWPLVNPCRVDQELVEQVYEDETFFEDEAVNVYGLDALEYLLFHEAPDNQCPPQTEINMSGSWDALDAAELEQRRARYAAAVADRIATDAGRLLDAWAPDGSDFLGELTRPDDGTTYDSSQEAVDAVFAAMFHVDLIVKDLKLAIPAGISPDCASDTCPEARESVWANLSKEHVVANLAGLEALYLGGAAADAEPAGFSGLLHSVQASELDERMRAALDAAQQAAEAIDGSLLEALDQDPEQVVALHDAVKALTDLIKSEFVGVLGLRIPDQGAGDND